MSGYGLPEPTPDVTHLVDVLFRRSRGGRVPMLEIGVDRGFRDRALRSLDIHVARRPTVDAAHEKLQVELDRDIAFYHQLGYDGMLARPIVAGPASRDRRAGSRTWAEEHVGLITSWSDFESYPWPTPGQADLFAFEYLAKHLPDGMGILASPFGAFQPAITLMGYETLAIALHEEPDLVRAVFDRIHELRVAMARTLVQLDRVVALWVLDDMGFKTGTLVSPDDLRRYALPIHRSIVEIGHGAGMPVLLHSCGNLAAIMDDIADVGFDAKHSFEDAIEPVESLHARYAERMTMIGGVDIDLLSRGTTADVRSRVREILERCAPRGGYVVGTGNSVADYVRLENYLAMVEERDRYAMNA